MDRHRGSRGPFGPGRRSCGACRRVGCRCRCGMTVLPLQKPRYHRHERHSQTRQRPKAPSAKSHPKKCSKPSTPHCLTSTTRNTTKTSLYRFCIEKGLLRADQIARTTFCRFIREYELLKPDAGNNKRRVAFSMRYANQLWQADTMFGPYIQNPRRQTKLISPVTADRARRYRIDRSSGRHPLHPRRRS